MAETIMQIGSFRQGVISPLDEESSMIGHGFSEGPVRVDYLGIHPNGGFNILWDDELFEVLSVECHLLLLDEHESECIPLEKIDMAIKALQKHKQKFTHDYTKVFVKMLIDLMESAKVRGYPVYFVL